MINKKILVTGTLATLLLTTLVAQDNCVGGVCFVNLKNLKPTKVFQEKKEKLVVLQKTRFVSSKSEFKDKSFDIIIDGKDTLIFSSYVMTAEEKSAYYREQKEIALNKKANEEANKELQRVIQPIEKIEDKILNKNLPTSEYFCDNDKKPVRVKNSDLYECVS